MSFQVSPGVAVREIDLTNVIPAVSVSIGGIAGHYEWGPVEQVVTVGSEKILADIFGQPTDATFKYFMPAAQFLQYANTLRVVRTNTDGLLNATAGGTGKLVKNADDFDGGTFVSGDEFIAKFPGAIGNSIGVAVVSNATAFASQEFETFAGQFDFAPDTTEFAESKGVSNDELHVVVYDSDGFITGTAGTVLEVFAGLSQARDAKRADGTSNYYVDFINTASRWVWVGRIDNTILTDAGKTVAEVLSEGDSSGGSFATSDTVEDYDLLGGSNGAGEPTLGELQSAYNLLSDAETVDVNFLIGVETGADDQTFANYLISVAQTRRDAVAFVSPSITRTVNRTSQDAVTEVKDWANGLTSSSYGVLDSTALYVYDKYNDKFRWIVAAGSVAGLCAFTDSVSDPWFSPAGFTRGQIRNVTRLALNPVQNQRDDLYKARINPIVSFPGEGTVLFGDKTAQSKPSAFDRINVRRLFIVLQKAIATAAKFQLFELNDNFTRAQFKSIVEPFLRDVQGRRGITEFLVVCDETNNTGEVIDSNRFVADIYIKPARSINFITLNFVAVRTGVDFSEIVGQF